MAALLDIIGSSFIGGIIMLLLLQVNIFVKNTTYNSDSELRLNQNVKTLAEILSHDLRKVGYDYDSTAVSIADSNRIRFKADIDLDGVAENIEYVTVDSSHAMGTQNESDIVLYRIVDNDTIKGPSLGLHKIKFTYLNQFKNFAFALSEIKYIKVELWVESTEIMENNAGIANYQKTYWEMTINPRNI